MTCSATAMGLTNNDLLQTCVIKAVIHWPLKNHSITVFFFKSGIKSLTNNCINLVGSIANPFLLHLRHKLYRSDKMPFV